MRQRIWRRLLAAAIAAIVVSGTALAQDRTPPPPLAIPLATSVSAEPAPGPTVPTVPTVPSVPAASAGTPVAPQADAVVVPAPPVAAPGLYDPAGTAGRGFVMTDGGYYHSNCNYGQRCNNGCGSLKSDCGFVFGSCRKFFAPCGPGYGMGGWLDGCRTPVYGTGSMFGPMNPCCYDSYLQH